MRIFGFAATAALGATLFLGAAAVGRGASGPHSAPFAARTLGTVALRIKVPSKPAADPSRTVGRLKPQYISPATLSVVVLTDGKNPVVANVSSGFANIVVRPPAGTHTFTVTAYDAYGGRGNVLSTGTTAPIVVPPVGEVLVALTLEGVVARVVLALDQTATTIGYHASIPLEVSAQDADGNVILGGTPFAHGLTLTSSDPRDGTLSQTTLAAPLQGVRVAYDGANVSPITFSVAGPGLVSVTAATLVPLPPPAAGEQLVVTGNYANPGNPNAAFAASGTHQLLTTFGLPPALPFYGYGEAATDAVARRLYVVSAYYVATPGGGDHIASRFDIFQAGGSYARVGSFQPSVDPAGVAIDSAAKIIYASDYFSLNVSLFSTAPGHASLGTITTGLCGAPGPDLAVDPVTKRLFVSVDGGCGGLTAFSTVPPYSSLGTLATGSSENLAVDSAAGKLYALEYDDEYSYETIVVYDTSTLKPVARIGPFAYGSAPHSIAVASGEHRLYALFPQSSLSPAASTVRVYGIDSGHRYPLLGSFTANGTSLTVAPFAP